MNAMHEYYCNKLDELGEAYDRQANGTMKILSIIEKDEAQVQLFKSICEDLIDNPNKLAKLVE